MHVQVFRKTFAAAAHDGSGGGGGCSVASLVATDCRKVYEGARGGGRGERRHAHTPSAAACLLQRMHAHTRARSWSRTAACACTRGALRAGVLHVHNVWTAPLEALAIIGLLLSITGGVHGLPSLVILVFGVPLQCGCGAVLRCAWGGVCGWKGAQGRSSPHGCAHGACACVATHARATSCHTCQTRVRPADIMGLSIARLKLQALDAADQRVQYMQVRGCIRVGTCSGRVAAQAHRGHARLRVWGPAGPAELLACACAPAHMHCHMPHNACAVVRVWQEILLAIKLVKMYVWEPRFVDQVQQVRARAGPARLMGIGCARAGARGCIERACARALYLLVAQQQSRGRRRWCTCPQARRAEVGLMARAALINTLNLCMVFAIPPVVRAHALRVPGCMRA